MACLEESSRLGCRASANGRKEILYRVTLLLALLLPISPHSWSELNDWLDDWQDRRQEARAELVQAVDWEFQNMLDRHPGWDGQHLDPPPPPRAEPSSIPSPSAEAAPDRGMGSGVEQWRGLVAAYFPADQVDRALCIMSYESGGNPSARNPSSSATGLMQVLFSTWGPRFGYDSRSDLEDPDVNLSIAAALWADGGWGHWSPYNRGLCH